MNTAGADNTVRRPGRLVIISGPSGAGKSTVLRELFRSCPLPLVYSVSATTRAPRPGEIDGREYFFLSPDRFEQLRRESAFLECKEVFGLGHWYGTLREQVASGLERGEWVVLEIDVAGAAEVLRSEFDPVTIFVHPGGMDELENRLRNRGTETEAQIAARLKTAAQEFERMSMYRHEVVNDTVGRAVAEICAILEQYQEP